MLVNKQSGKRRTMHLYLIYSHNPLFLHHMQILVIALMNRSSDVNVVHEGSPSRMRRVRLISFGITILPKSSTLLTMPVAFIYLSPFPQGTTYVSFLFRFAMRNGTQAVPYNNFTNYDAIICKRGRFILLEFTFQLMYVII